MNEEKILSFQFFCCIIIIILINIIDHFDFLSLLSSETKKYILEALRVFSFSLKKLQFIQLNSFCDANSLIKHILF
jgi:hypothetical protein